MNYANSAQFAPPTVHEFRKIRTIRLTCYTLCFSHLSRQRTLWNSSELRKFHAIRLHSPRITQNSHILLTYSILCFRHLPRQKKKLSEIPADHANSVQFTHIVRESREIRRQPVNLFYIMFQAPAPAENPAEFQRITQIPRDSPTQPANHANSAHFALKFKYM